MCCFFFFNDTAPTEIYTLSLHDALPISSGGSYMTTITVGGALWSQDGWYTISASQADASMYKASTEVDIKDGHVVPEFGTIAIMILVVAIVSIIALSAKTKLSLVPRY